MKKLEITDEEQSALLDCLGLVLQMQQDPKQTLVNASRLLPLAAKVQSATECSEPTPQE